LLPEGLLVKNSTSLFQIDGDRAFSKLFYPIYFGINCAENALPNRRPSTVHCESKDFRVPIDEDAWSQVELLGSPSRILSEMFWNKVPWEEIGKIIRVPNIVDVGCGEGYLLTKIQQVRGMSGACYRGVDSVRARNWAYRLSENERADFVLASAENVEEYLDGEQNIIISQSALEHFRYDLNFFRKIHRYMTVRSGPTLHIHCIPAARCLWLYGLHGYRQYTERKIVQLLQPFGKEISATLYGLGGSSCASVHKRYINRFPFLFRKEKRASHKYQYINEVKRAIQDDMSRRIPQDPLFYALVFVDREFKHLLRDFV